MESYARPLRALADEAGWFVRARELRLLHVVASQPLREAAIDVVMAQEYHAENRSPFVRADTPWTVASGGWEARITALREQHAARREAMAKAGAALPELLPLPAREGGVESFARQVHQLLLARCEPLEGVVVVLAPVGVEDPARWEQELTSVLGAALLAPVRWVLVDLERPSVRGLARRLGGAALEVQCRLDDAEVQRDVAQRIDAAASAPAGAEGPCQVGAAWPRNAVPPGALAKELSAAERGALAASLGVPAGMLGSGLASVRTLVLRAAQAMRRGDAQGALGFQRDAAVRCMEAGLLREGTLMEMVLATYVVHAGQRPVAEGMYRACAQRAQERAWPDLAAQALMAAASLRLIERDPDEAAALYARAAVAAQGGGAQGGGADRGGAERGAPAVGLAIEGYRMAGQLRAEAGDVEQATRLWTQAVALAGPLPLAQAGQTSAPVAARALAALCRERGLKAQALALEAQGARMERG